MKKLVLLLFVVLAFSSRVLAFSRHWKAVCYLPRDCRRVVDTDFYLDGHQLRLSVVCQTSSEQLKAYFFPLYTAAPSLCGLRLATPDEVQFQKGKDEKLWCEGFIVED